MSNVCVLGRGVGGPYLAGPHFGGDVDRGAAAECQLVVIFHLRAGVHAHVLGNESAASWVLNNRVARVQGQLGQLGRHPWKKAVGPSTLERNHFSKKC